MSILGIIFYFGTGYFLTAIIRTLIALLGDPDSDKDWGRRHPYHFIAKALVERSEEEAVPYIAIGLVLIIISVVAFWVSCFDLNSGISRVPTIVQLCGFGSYLLLAWGYALRNYLKVKNFSLGKRWKMLRANSIAWLHKSWLKRRPLEISQAKDSYEKLLALISDNKQKEALKPILDNVKHLVRKELPRLLKRRQQLVLAVKTTSEAIAKQEANGITPGEDLLLAQSKNDLTTLKDHQQKVETKINLILAFIDLIQSQVCVIIDAVNAEMSDRVENLIAQVQEEVTLMRQSHEEIQGLAEKYLLDEKNAKQAALAEVQQTEQKLRQPRKAAAG